MKGTMEKQVILDYFCYDTEEEQYIAFTVKHLSNKIMSLPSRQSLSNLPGLSYENVFLAWPIPQNMSRIKSIQSSWQDAEAEENLPTETRKLGSALY